MPPDSYPTASIPLAVADALDEALFVVDERWRRRWTNRCGVKLLASAGILPDGDEFLALFPADARTRIVLDGSCGTGGGDCWQGEVEVAGVEALAVGITIAPFVEGGAPQGWRWVRLSDRSAQQALEAELRESRSLAHVGRLAVALSHHLSELLTAIAGSAELIAAELTVGETEGASAAGSARDRPDGARATLEHDAMRADVETIRRAAERAAVLTRELSRAATSRQAAPQRTDVSGAIAAMDATLRRSLGDGVSLTFDLDPAAGESVLDLSQFEAAILALAHNARAAMPYGGELSMTTRGMDQRLPRRAMHGVIRPGRYAVVEIRDSGCGMDDPVLARSFEPLYSTWGGEGLGLSFVFGVLRQAGGYVGCESRLGAGTMVSLFLPVDAERAAGQTGRLERSRDAGERAEGPSILLVDDEESVRRVAARTLRRAGFRVVEASDADEALALVSNDPTVADLLVTDVAMPGLSGVELANCILAARPDVRILFSSGTTALTHGEASRLPRGAAFLPKPFTPKGLSDRVAAILAK